MMLNFLSLLSNRFCISLPQTPNIDNREEDMKILVLQKGICLLRYSYTKATVFCLTDLQIEQSLLLLGNC